MSEYLTPSSDKWEALDVLSKRLWEGNCAAGSSEKCLYLSGVGGFDSQNGQLLSKRTAKFISALHKKEAIITIDDWNDLFFDLLHMDNLLTINKGWFFDTIGEHNHKLANGGDELDVKLFAGLVKFWEISDEIVNGKNVIKKVKPVKLYKSLAEEIGTKMTELADNGELDSLTTKLIGENLKDYKFVDFKIAIANRIGEKLRSVDKSVDLTKFLVKKQYEAYIDFKQIIEDGTHFWTLTENIYSGDQPKIAVGALSPEEQKGFSYPGAFQYPDALITKSDGTIDEKLKSDLKNYKDLDGTEIVDYPFQYVKDSYPAKTMYLGLVDSFQKAGDTDFFNWFKRFSAELSTPAEVIQNAVKSSYLSFLKGITKDFQENTELSITIGTQWDIATSDQSDAFALSFPLIFLDKMVAAKKTLFDKLAGVNTDADTDGDGAADTSVDQEAREKAYEDQLEAFKEGKGKDVEVQSDEDLENRQKFFKQCALMLNMPSLHASYQAKINARYATKIPFGGRFTTLYSKSKEQETMLSSLVSSAKEQRLFELETHKISKLVPKIRLFKVFHHPTDGEKEVEFIFDRSSNIRSTFMGDGVFDKGTGVGLKNFSFEFNGTSPATARNDITASLTLFFQSFQDFTRERTGYNKSKYRYVDLIIQPTPDKKGQVDGLDVQSDRQYEPQFYRIRADVGYVLPTVADGFTKEEITAIQVSNKSFFLNMVDHDISFGKDGTVEIKISYRAYLESLLKHPRLDALASPELIAKRIANARELTRQTNLKNCSVEQLKELQVSLAAQETVLIKQSLSSIITRLRSRGVIYNVLVNKGDKQDFLEKGFFKTCSFEIGAEDDGSDGVDVKLVLNSDLPESSDDFDFIDSGDRAIQFFYFGDLLYTVLDCVYDGNDAVRAGTGFNRNSIVLGSFEFEPFQTSAAGGSVYNIADIPISVDFFSRWFVDNVVNQKSTRKTFPVKLIQLSH
jgi:hypothetical protein